MKILFATNSYFRKPEFSVGTLIYSEGKKYTVRKHLLHPQAAKHLHEFVQNQKVVEKYLPDIYFPEVIKKTKEYVEYEYLPYPTLEKLIEQSLVHREFQEVDKLVHTVLSVTRHLPTLDTTPYHAGEFAKIFDRSQQYASDEWMLCAQIGILDANADNLLQDQHKRLILIDHEWFYQFPIPQKYLLFRAVYWLSRRLQTMLQAVVSPQLPCYEVLPGLIIPRSWLTAVDATWPEIEKFLFYEKNFQEYVSFLKNQSPYQLEQKEPELHTNRYVLNFETYLQEQIDKESSVLSRSSVKATVKKLRRFFSSVEMI